MSVSPAVAGANSDCAIAVASPDQAFALSLAERISSGGFRAYTQPDIVGVEIGGAVKNVLAIATGGPTASATDLTAAYS